jgi:hypothetical protein
VTFLFTDIVGSTPSWDRDREAMALSVARHDEIVRETIGKHDGVVFATAGDSFGAAFGDADRAADAALEIMGRLDAEPWASGTPIRVRAGLHTGVADERDDDYFGPTVNRSARICDAGNGGQVVLSAVTAVLVTRHRTVELGTYRLRGVSDLVVVHQLCGSVGDFGALRSQGAAVSTLPIPVSSLFGRGEDIARVAALVGRQRLVTVTGAGGCGKTRLAIAVGHQLGGRFPTERRRWSSSSSVLGWTPAVPSARPSPRSAHVWIVCRWRSSSPRPARRCSPPPTSSIASMTGSGC